MSMTSKCGLCQKSVYPNDAHLNLDSQLYHKGCAKCEDCKCQITLANFTKTGDLLLCKTHYFERFNTQGSYAGSEKFKKSATANSAPVRPVNVAPVTSSTPSRNEPLSEKALSVKERLKKFGATVNESNKCAVCTKSVYPNDPQLSLDGNKYHKGCAKCADCQCQIDTSNFTRSDTTLYCKTHYLKRFKEQGKFVGEEKFTRQRGTTNADYLAGHSQVKGSSNPPNPPTQDEEKAKAEEEEAARRQAEEEDAARRQAEEEAAARKKAEEEEAARRQAEEEEAARRQAEEEEAARRQVEEEEAAKRQAEEEEAVKRQAEEEEAAKRQAEEEAVRRQAEEEEAARLKTEEEEAAARQKAEEEATNDQQVEETTNDDGNDDDENESV